MADKALVLGNSDGIGLGITTRLLEAGWEVSGISRSKSPIDNTAYRHEVFDVSNPGYPELLSEMMIRLGWGV